MYLQKKVLILVNGVFGTRMEDIANRLGADVDSLHFEWGHAVDIDIVANQLSENKYDLVAVVHAETSTGVCNPVKEIGEFVEKGEKRKSEIDINLNDKLIINTFTYGDGSKFSYEIKCS